MKLIKLLQMSLYNNVYNEVLNLIHVLEGLHHWMVGVDGNPWMVYNAPSLKLWGAVG